MQGEKFNITFRGFMKGMCQGRMPQLAKWRVARGASVNLSQWSWVEGADRGELAPSAFRIGKLPKRTYGSIICDSSRESKEPIRLEGDKE
jgi:hypothetical protein